MEVHILDIPPEGYSIQASSDQDPWLNELITQACHLVSARSAADLSLTLSVHNEADVLVSGQVTLELTPSCDRCLEASQSTVIVKLDHYLLPAVELESEEADQELKVEDLQFGTYEGDVLQVSQFIQEQIVLALPVRYLCDESCEGLCPECGGDLNQISCDCASEAAGKGSPFAMLESLKI